MFNEQNGIAKFRKQKQSYIIIFKRKIHLKVKLESIVYSYSVHNGYNCHGIRRVRGLLRERFVISVGTRTVSDTRDVIWSARFFNSISLIEFTNSATADSARINEI